MSISDKEFYHLTISINKALNPMEAPLKIKHARSVIITTHRTKEAKSLWAVMTRQPLMENRFTSWKFCHLLHKILREGHETSIKNSQSHKKMILEMGKLWGHLQDGVGHCIQAYSKLIVTKLDFHEKNQIFPGSLFIEFREIEKFATEDINIYFQLCIEIFDYLDDIIDVQLKVFASINTYRMSSMTPQGQCRLAPLITLIQDSNPLYDLSVRLMFKLHDKLPNDILIGHRDRFRDIFTKLKAFYDNVRPLQYFADLIQVPHLPETSPNFTSKIDFGSYIPPIVVVPPEPEPNTIVDNLVEMNNIQEQDIDSNYSEKILAYKNDLKDKDEVISHLHIELTDLRAILNLTQTAHQQDVHKLREDISVLNAELNDSKEFGHNIRGLKDELELKLQATPPLLQKVKEEEEKAKVSEEKFIKLKNMYTQIRDEHIHLLRQHGEATKYLNKAKNENIELVTQNNTLNDQLNELKLFKSNITTEFELKMNDLLTDHEKLRISNEGLQQQYSILQKDKSDETDNLTVRNDQLIACTKELKEYKLQLSILEKKCIESHEQNLNEKLEQSDLINELKTKFEFKVSEGVELEQKYRNEVEKTTSDFECKINKILADYEKICASYKKLQQDYEYLEKIKSEEITNLSTQNIQLLANTKKLEECQLELATLESNFSECNKKLCQEKTEQTDKIFKLKEDLDAKVENNLVMEQKHITEIEVKNIELQEVKAALNQEQSILKEKETVNQRLVEEKMLLENELQDLLQQNAIHESKITELRKDSQHLSLRLSDNEIKYKSTICSLMLTVIKAVGSASLKKLDEKEFRNFENIFETNKELKNTLNELQIVYNMHTEDKDVVESLTRKAILIGQHFSTLKLNCMLLYNNTDNIEKGQGLLLKINSARDVLQELFQALTLSYPIENVELQISTVKSCLDDLNNFVNDLLQTTNASVDLGNLVEIELSQMDKVIEEAAEKIVEMLSSARSIDSGIKLEVNEKILDACTNLMKCIKVLIQKSKILQGEIVSLGRGTASAQEFYKRNSQWSEGLISASKSVAKGANLLVEAANKAVSGESSKSFEIIVAAQEIAACTAQLVVASKVKAPRESQKLGDLTKASRNVSQATGLIVATVKDCNQQLELSQELDFSKLTSNQAKTMEMDIHVKVLELEQALQVERLRLSAFRRQNYQNTED